MLYARRGEALYWLDFRGAILSVLSENGLEWTDQIAARGNLPPPSWGKAEPVVELEEYDPATQAAMKAVMAKATAVAAKRKKRRKRRKP